VDICARPFLQQAVDEGHVAGQNVVQDDAATVVHVLFENSMGSVCIRFWLSKAFTNR